MAKECFCGCGRAIPRFPLGSRSANTRGRLVAERLIWFSALWKEPADAASATDENLEEWFEDGFERLDEIRDMLHGDVDPALVDPRASSDWLKYGRGIDVVFQGLRLSDSQSVAERESRVRE